jgi:hypothetical protein
VSPVYDGKVVAGQTFPSPPLHDRTPFFKTVPGIILIVALAVVLTGVIIGGAVGGTCATPHKASVAAGKSLKKKSK